MKTLTYEELIRVYPMRKIKVCKSRIYTDALTFNEDKYLPLVIEYAKQSKSDWALRNALTEKDKLKPDVFLPYDGKKPSYCIIVPRDSMVYYTHPALYTFGIIHSWHDPGTWNWHHQYHPDYTPDITRKLDTTIVESHPNYLIGQAGMSYLVDKHGCANGSGPDWRERWNLKEYTVYDASTGKRIKNLPPAGICFDCTHGIHDVEIRTIKLRGTVSGIKQAEKEITELQTKIEKLKAEIKLSKESIPVKQKALTEAYKKAKKPEKVVGKLEELLKTD